MMKHSTVTVVIPAFKAAGFIRATLDSTVAQTRIPTEVIVADDRSPDDTVEVVTTWGKTAPFPVRVIRLARNSGGPAAPLNAAIKAASGDLIATLDHDDCMEPDKLERQAAVLTSIPSIGLVFHRAKVVGTTHPADVLAYLADVDRVLSGIGGTQAIEGGVLLPQRAAHRALAELNYTVSCSTMLFSKRIWERVGGFEPYFRAACDYAFVERVTRCCDVAALDAQLVRWVRHAETLTANTGFNRSQLECWHVLNRMASLYPAGEIANQLRATTDCILNMAYQHRLEQRNGSALALYGSVLWHRPSLRVALRTAKSVLRRRTKKAR